MEKFKSRHKQEDDKQQNELIVVGYGCNLYEPKDEDLSGRIGGANFLIPWNGDEDTKIDRYDSRLYLTSLDEFDNPIRSKSNPDETEQEQLEEELCDEERYRELVYPAEYDEAHTSTDETTSKKRAAISFTYEDQPAEKKSQNLFDLDDDENDDQKPYEVPEGLKLPEGLNKPQTEKQGRIIEKTALFIIKNGAQMEVVLKAKFGRSPLFGFLDFDHILHPLYKYICKLIRENKYIPKLPKTEENTNGNRDNADHGDPDETDSDNDGYELHPLLAGSVTPNEPGKQKFGPVQKSKQNPIENKTPSLDLNSLVQQHHSESKTSIYSSLLNRLNTVLPGAIKIDDRTNIKNTIEAQSQPTLGLEDDKTVINAYNQWHYEFYGRPSPYLPNPPPKIHPPPPNISSSISLAARYVALNGPEAQQKLIDHNRDNVKFLFSESPYYTFFQSRIRSVKETLIYQQAQNMLFQQTSSGFVFQPQQSTSADAEIVGIKNSNSPLPLIAYQQCSSSSRPLITYQPCGQDDDIAPTEIIASSVDDNESDIQNELSSNDPRQKERREKARLFMEKIMNEKLSSKKREKSSRNNGSQTHSSNALDSQRSNDLQSPIVIPTEAISQLIDKKLEQILPTSSKKSHSRTPDRYRTKSRSRSRSRSRTSDEDYRRRKAAKKRRKRSRSRTPKRHSRRKGSRSRSTERRRKVD